MRILVSHLHLDAPGGTEVYALLVSEQLQLLGHEVALVTWREGRICARAEAIGVPVVAPEDLDGRAADVAIACDAATLLEIAGRAAAPIRIMVMHSTEYVLQTPPQLPGVAHAVVVLNHRVGRRAEALAFSPRIVRLSQPVDLPRYHLLARARRPMRRVAIFGNHASDMLTTTCRELGLEPVVVGGQSMTLEPERILGEVDAVLGIGRCAIEGLAARRPVFVVGPAGADGWVTLDSYAALENDGFSGRAGLLPPGPAQLRRHLAEPPGLAEIQRLYERVCRDHDAAVHTEQLVALSRELGAEAGPATDEAAEMARLVRVEFGARMRAVNAESELRTATAAALANVDELVSTRAELSSVRAELRKVDARRAALRRRLLCLERSRRWRLAQLLAAPYDAVRRRRSATAAGHGPARRSP